MTPCPATHGDHACRRLNGGNDQFRIPHPMPHLAADGTQWDHAGIRVAQGNHPWKGEIQ